MITSLKIEFKRNLKVIKGVLFVWLVGFFIFFIFFYLYERDIMKQYK